MVLMIWGTGSRSKNLTNYILKNNKIFNVKIIAYIDNNIEMCGGTYNGKPVIAPNDINNYNYDYIEIASVQEEAIKFQCLNVLHISKDKISVQGEIFRKYYTKYQYQNRYEGKEINNFIETKIVVYTANFGKYDNLLDPLFKDDSIKYVCFTDDKDFSSKIWDIEYVNNINNMDLAKLVRYYKFFPNKFFPQYEISIWVDSKYQILNNFRDYINKYHRKSSMLCFPHFFRNCIYEEAEECIRVGKGNEKQLRNQIKAYHNAGYPQDNGLYECGCLVRWNKDIKLQETMQLWWDEINKYSVRDQISLPYVAWKNKFKIDISELDIASNFYMKQIGHNK